MSPISILAQTPPPPEVPAVRLVFWLITTLVISATTAFVLYLKVVDQFDEKLAESKSLRGFFVLISSLLVPVLIALLVDIVDVSALFSSKGTESDLYLLAVTIVLAVAQITAQMMWWKHSDSWDNRVLEFQEAVELAQRDGQTSKEQRDFYILVNEFFLGVVALKAERAIKKLKRERNRSSPQKMDTMMTSVLSPPEQIIKLLQTPYLLFKKDLPAGDKIRIAYFKKSADGILIPEYSYNGTSTDCVKGPLGDDKPRFDTSKKAGNCLAVYAALTSQIQIIEDAQKAHTDPTSPFSYFSNSQHNDIKSLVAIPLGKEEPADKVLCIDCSRAGFFKHSLLWQVNCVKENLEHRLLLETDVQELLELS